MKTADSPIINSPYQEPSRHYATDTSGQLNYTQIRAGRRIFAPDVPQVPLNQPTQTSLYDLNDLKSEYATQLVNLLREQVGQWRISGYQGVSSRVTLDLLNYWFANPERADHHKLFFAQQEAVETAIWLNEVAEKANTGTHILDRLLLAQASAGDQPYERLPRIAFKMATGTGKTVVMACLILYHFLNRREYRSDTRYADDFLIVAPGITIRDRLNVLIPDAEFTSPAHANDYYRQRALVPPQYTPALGELAHHLTITNFHAFERRAVSGNKRSPLDGKLGLDGKKTAALEDDNLMVRRVLEKFKPGRRLLIINDEAHHCYLPRAKGKDTEFDNSETENERAAVWFSGLVAFAQRFKVRAVYDLSATPYFLSGSGYPAYSFFPWVVSDFGLVEAIESGLVKIPYLPVDDSSQAIEEPVLKDLYQHCKEGLPKKGLKTKRKDDKAEGKDAKSFIEPPPQLPELVKLALDQFYEHYVKYENGLRQKGELGADMLSEPPVFIVVCNNTTVSKEVYKEIAGYESVDASGERAVRPGRLSLFSNYDRDTLAPRRRPPTLLIDSDALENSGQIDEDFKRVFKPEIEQFKRDYRVRYPERSADALTDADILREVVNTVGKPGALGSHIRCVVSVSMLTEGWDANTVTHVMGLRAFGSNLLCEQVAGRALRRRHYLLDKKTGKFPPEYAHIIGIPFKLFKGGETTPPERQEVHYLRALPDRADLEIRFPNVLGYRLDTPAAELRADFSATPDFLLDLTKTPATSELGTAVSGDRETLETKIDDIRDQEVIFWLTTQFMKRQFATNDPGEQARADVRRFNQAKEIVSRWYRDKLKVVGEVDDRYKRMAKYFDPVPMIENINMGFVAGSAQAAQPMPIFNAYQPVGATRFVVGQTTKPVFVTKKSHVNFVVADTESWEQIAAKTLEHIDAVESYVKNAFLGFSIPYVNGGKDRRYHPDFLIRLKTPDGNRANLILEVTGFNDDKTVKRWFVNERWLPAVNAHQTRLGLPRYHFVEVSDILNVKRQLTDEIRRIASEVDDQVERDNLWRIQCDALADVWDHDADELFDAPPDDSASLANGNPQKP